jgi:hypothetical protein
MIGTDIYGLDSDHNRIAREWPVIIENRAALTTTNPCDHESANLPGLAVQYCRL